MQHPNQLVAFPGPDTEHTHTHSCRILDNSYNYTTVAWRSGNALCRINEVTPHRARLVLGWVTVYGQVNHLCMKPAS